MKFALLVATLAVSPCLAASPYARTARLTVSGEELVVGAADKAANGRLDCPAGAVQHTVLRCKPAAAVAPFTACLGRRVESAAVTLHYQGQVLNMSVEFAAGSNIDDVLSQLRSDLGAEPKVQYWADDAHLYASYIWVDQETEIEVTKTVKGSGDGKVRLYASTLLGGLPLSPDDQP